MLARRCRSAARNWERPEDSSSAAGFRVALVSAEALAKRPSPEFAILSKLPPTPSKVTIQPADRAIVRAVLKVTSEVYLERGFKEFRFGDSETHVGEIVARDKVQHIGDGRQVLFYDADDRLVGYERLYLGDTDQYVSKLRELLGGAPAEDISKATWAQGMRQDVLSVGVLARYSFPHTIASVEVVSNAHPDRSNSDGVTLTIFDRGWLEEHLARDVAEKRQVLMWVRENVAQAKPATLYANGMPVYPRTKLVRKSEEYTEAVMLIAERPSPEVGAFSVAGVSGPVEDVFLAVVTQKKELPHRQPVGTSTIAVHCSCLPAWKKNLVREYDRHQLEIASCDSAVCQQVFPPATDKIQVFTGTKSYFKTFSWRTADGWKVVVGHDPTSDFYLNNAPEKGL